ncbi:hypothetical protein QJS10_CPA03g01532 [Acorus calamus]|uniref:Uncharacterized protein n=1 Tax=Acorus calamus TaxID=4465 RepID=A0AAV9F930_ACOCL|nr:hypothetical protein QJS10_CPA03g01532 [Acorus calamus]
MHFEIYASICIMKIGLIYVLHSWLMVKSFENVFDLNLPSTHASSSSTFTIILHRHSRHPSLFMCCLVSPFHSRRPSLSSPTFTPAVILHFLNKIV